MAFTFMTLCVLIAWKISCTESIHPKIKKAFKNEGEITFLAVNRIYYTEIDWTVTLVESHPDI